MRPALVALALTLSCRSEPARSQPAPAPPAAAAIDVGARGASWDRAVAALADTRAELAAAWRAAETPAARAAIRDRASAALLAAITDELAPAWFGMRWGMGRDSTATRPFAPDQTISCSYFVGAVLGGAGFRLHDRFKLGQAAALRIQQSLVGGRGEVHRFLSIPPADLAARIARLGDGVYVIGLANHVGLVVVRGADVREGSATNLLEVVRFVHASYLGDAVVTSEPLATSPAIAASRPKGYFVSPLITAAGAADDWLIERWLTGAAVGPTG
jgi:hypothetical protein